MIRLRFLAGSSSVVITASRFFSRSFVGACEEDETEERVASVSPRREECSLSRSFSRFECEEEDMDWLT